jgi:hypothetical protein
VVINSILVLLELLEFLFALKLEKIEKMSVIAFMCEHQKDICF